MPKKHSKAIGLPVGNQPCKKGFSRPRRKWDSHYRQREDTEPQVINGVYRVR